jgi:hypothetical protein
MDRPDLLFSIALYLRRPLFTRRVVRIAFLKVRGLRHGRCRDRRSALDAVNFNYSAATLLIFGNEKTRGVMAGSWRKL